MENQSAFVYRALLCQCALRNRNQPFMQYCVAHYAEVCKKVNIFFKVSMSFLLVNTTRPVTTVPSVTTVPPTSTVPVPSLQPACDDKYTHKVYQCPDNNTVALENTTSGIVQIFSWLPGGVKRFTKQTSASFRSHPCYAEIPTGLAKERKESLLFMPSIMKKIRG